MSSFSTESLRIYLISRDHWLGLQALLRELARDLASRAEPTLVADLNASAVAVGEMVAGGRWLDEGSAYADLDGKPEHVLRRIAGVLQQAEQLVDVRAGLSHLEDVREAIWPPYRLPPRPTSSEGPTSPWDIVPTSTADIPDDGRKTAWEMLVAWFERASREWKNPDQRVQLRIAPSLLGRVQDLARKSGFEAQVGERSPDIAVLEISHRKSKRAAPEGRVDTPAGNVPASRGLLLGGMRKQLIQQFKDKGYPGAVAVTAADAAMEVLRRFTDQPAEANRPRAEQPAKMSKAAAEETTPRLKAGRPAGTKGPPKWATEVLSNKALEHTPEWQRARRAVNQWRYRNGLTEHGK